ncbi:hypothetical protein [Mycolicibacterium vaccae]|uniref:hypothetical protein n=1 Tax=Mycolicibacterium vaccae TaxID=1810 RepID=UPI003D01945A
MSDLATIPTLASVFAEHRWYRTTDVHWAVRCTSCSWTADLRNTAKTSTQLVAEHAEQVWREKCTIRTGEQLDALPHLARIRYAYESPAGWKHDQIWERRNDSWLCISAPLSPPAGDFGVPELPARLLWHPDWSYQ